MRKYLGRIIALCVVVFNCGIMSAQAPFLRQIDTLDKGFIFYQFAGFEPVTGADELIYVSEFDMNDPRYKVVFQYKEDRRTTSQAFKEANALATINATYEKESVYIKMDGSVHWAIDSPVVPGSRVPQWKTDAAIALDSDGDVHIEWTGKGITIPETRKKYIAMDYPYIFTSSPMLIEDYEPVGKTFAEKGLSDAEVEKLDYEDPLRHQHVRHPRTAVAMTGDNHLLLIVVDGRRPGLAEGMNAAELTTFIEHYFHPRYCINMDGGGSTAMCVRGMGDPVKHVVNFPSKNATLIRDYERAVPTHISVVLAE